MSALSNDDFLECQHVITRNSDRMVSSETQKHHTLDTTSVFWFLVGFIHIVSVSTHCERGNVWPLKCPAPHFSFPCRAFVCYNTVLLSGCIISTLGSITHCFTCFTVKLVLTVAAHCRPRGGLDSEN